MAPTHSTTPPLFSPVPIPKSPLILSLSKDARGGVGLGPGRGAAQACWGGVARVLRQAQDEWMLAVYESVRLKSGSQSHSPTFTKLSITRLRPAVSKSISSLLPSCAAITP